MKAFHSLLLTTILLFSTSAIAAQDPADKVNINTANAEQIASGINGIGESKARAIVEYRSSHGKFESIESLQNVDGIGEKTIEKNKDKISL